MADRKVQCKFCDEVDLVWKRVEGKPTLMNEQELPHFCEEGTKYYDQLRTQEKAMQDMKNQAARQYRERNGYL